jgi:hypothetical protein
MNSKSFDGLARLTTRFEIALANFGRSCFSLRANEKAFQAWYAAGVIQEFGLARVYREVHLDKQGLFTVAPRKGLLENVPDGNEIFPDLIVAWEPDIDARHSSTRDSDVQDPAAMLRGIAIVTELKVTGSTGRPTPASQVRQDLAKLALVASVRSRSGEGPMATYMVIMDNCAREGGFYPDAWLLDDPFLAEVRGSWPAGTPLATLAVIRSDGVTFYRGLEARK